MIFRLDPDLKILTGPLPEKNSFVADPLTSTLPFSKLISTDALWSGVKTKHFSTGRHRQLSQQQAWPIIFDGLNT